MKRRNFLKLVGMAVMTPSLPTAKVVGGVSPIYPAYWIIDDVEVTPLTEDSDPKPTKWRKFHHEP